jgi:hypothetical protein
MEHHPCLQPHQAQCSVNQSGGDFDGQDHLTEGIPAGIEDPNIYLVEYHLMTIPTKTMDKNHG